MNLVRLAIPIAWGLVAAACQCGPGGGGTPRPRDAGADAMRSVLDAAPDAGASVDAGADAGVAARCPGPRVAQVSERNVHGGQVCAVRQDGGLVCWGSNLYGELGIGAVNPIDDPNRPPTEVLPGEVVAEVEAGDGFTCARLVDGSVRCAGRNAQGQLGNGDAPNDAASWVSATGLADARSLDSGRLTVCATRDASALSCWGWDVRSHQTSVRFFSTPTVEPRVLGVVSRVAVGEQALCALSAGRVHCAVPDTGPVPFGPDASVTDFDVIGGGIRHFCAQRADGTLRCWGQNFDGQLGDRTRTDSDAPVTVAGVSDVRAVAGGWGHTCVVRDDRSVWCWGRADEGQLGRGTFDSAPVLEPARVPGLDDVVDLDAAYSATCAVTAAGDLLCWGRLDYADGTRGQQMFAEPRCVDVTPR